MVDNSETCTEDTFVAKEGDTLYLVSYHMCEAYFFLVPHSIFYSFYFLYFFIFSAHSCSYLPSLHTATVMDHFSVK